MPDGRRFACAGGDWIEVNKDTTLKDLKWLRPNYGGKRKWKVKGKNEQDYFVTAKNKKCKCTCGKKNCSHIETVRKLTNACGTSI